MLSESSDPSLKGWCLDQIKFSLKFDLSRLKPPNYQILFVSADLFDLQRIPFFTHMYISVTSHSKNLKPQTGKETALYTTASSEICSFICFLINHLLQNFHKFFTWRENKNVVGRLKSHLEHSITRNALRSYLAEFISTFIFVFAAVGSAMSSSESPCHACHFLHWWWWLIFCDYCFNCREVAGKCCITTVWFSWQCSSNRFLLGCRGLCFSRCLWWPCESGCDLWEGDWRAY